MFGASLLYGDGIITPAITVLGAVEGLNVATPLFTPYVVPISLAILFGLFLVQSRGTAAVGAMFGPVMLVWFAAIAALGGGPCERAVGAGRLQPGPRGSVLRRERLARDRGAGLGVPRPDGGEAFYADIGHFGRKPIRAAWFFVAWPALMLNYLGQGALLLADPEAATSPFYRLAPTLLVPHW